MERSTGCPPPSRVLGEAQGDGAQPQGPHLGSASPKKAGVPLPTAARGRLVSPPTSASLDGLPVALAPPTPLGLLSPSRGQRWDPFPHLPPSSYKELRRVGVGAAETKGLKLQVQWQRPRPDPHLWAPADCLSFPNFPRVIELLLFPIILEAI